MTDQNEIDLTPGLTGLGNILQIGAIVSNRKFSSSLNCSVLPTIDTKQMERLDTAIDNALLAVTNASVTIGTLLGHCEGKELSESDIKNIGWLIVGMGEISQELIREKDDVTYELIQRAVKVGK